MVLCTACSEKYDALVMRLMVVVARAAVAAEQLDKAVKADKGTPDSSSHLKPGALVQNSQQLHCQWACAPAEPSRSWQTAGEGSQVTCDCA